MTIFFKKKSSIREVNGKAINFTVFDDLQHYDPLPSIQRPLHSQL